MTTITITTTSGRPIMTTALKLSLVIFGTYFTGQWMTRIPYGNIVLNILGFARCVIMVVGGWSTIRECSGLL